MTGSGKSIECQPLTRSASRPGSEYDALLFGLPSLEAVTKISPSFRAIFELSTWNLNI